MAILMKKFRILGSTCHRSDQQQVAKGHDKETRRNLWRTLLKLSIATNFIQNKPEDEPCIENGDYPIAHHVPLCLQYTLV
jgi:hypothetical protein